MGRTLVQFLKTICEETGHLEDVSIPKPPALLPPRSSSDKVTNLGDTIMTRSSFSRHSPFLLKANEIATRIIESLKGLYATSRTLPTLAHTARLTPGQSTPSLSTAPSGRFHKKRRGAFTILNLGSSSAGANLLGADTTTYGPGINTQ
jgi:hypothetical protein